MVDGVTVPEEGDEPVELDPSAAKADGSTVCEEMAAGTPVTSGVTSSGEGTAGWGAEMAAGGPATSGVTSNGEGTTGSGGEMVAGTPIRVGVTSNIEGTTESVDVVAVSTSGLTVADVGRMSSLEGVTVLIEGSTTPLMNGVTALPKAGATWVEGVIARTEGLCPSFTGEAAPVEGGIIPAKALLNSRRPNTAPTMPSAKRPSPFRLFGCCKLSMRHTGPLLYAPLLPAGHAPSGRYRTALPPL